MSESVELTAPLREGAESPWIHDGSPGRRAAMALAVPGAFILAASVSLLPWLVETCRRLQNEYWEGQLEFACLACAMASAGFPALILRVLCRRRTVAQGCWVVTLLGYLAVFSYVAQSHFPLVHKLAIALPTLGATALAWKAWRSDLKLCGH